MNAFDAEVRERKRLASNARHKKNGSKSKRCSLPTDHMTEKQWKERCGQVMEYKLNEPIPWAVFKAYPKDIQEMYIQNMVDKYHVTASDLGRLFGCHYGTVSRFCQKHGLQVPFAAGRRMSPEEKTAFQRLLAQEGPEETDGGAGFEAASDAEDFPEDTTLLRSSPMAMRSFSLSFEGAYDPAMVLNSLSSIIQEGEEVSFHITCEFLE